MNAHLEEAERAAEDGGPRVYSSIELACTGGCNGPIRIVPRSPEDPPTATRLVFHSCSDPGPCHYENEKGEKL